MNNTLKISCKKDIYLRVKKIPDLHLLLEIHWGHL